MRWIILLSLLLMPVMGYAVDAEIKSITKDENRNIYWVDVDYVFDGKTVRNSYPVAAYNLIDKTDAEVASFLKVNIEHQCGNYVANKFFKSNNTLQPKVDKLIGNKYKITEVDTEIDTKTYTIKEDGTFVEKTVNP